MVNNLKKEDLIKSISFKKGFSNNYSKKLLNDLIKILINNIKDGNLIIKNIGSFKLKKKAKRMGRNPRTKDEFIISSRKSVSFSASKNMLEKLNKFI